MFVKNTLVSQIFILVILFKNAMKNVIQKVKQFSPLINKYKQEIDAYIFI